MHVVHHTGREMSVTGFCLCKNYFETHISLGDRFKIDFSQKNVMNGKTAGKPIPVYNNISEHTQKNTIIRKSSKNNNKRD